MYKKIKDALKNLMHKYMEFIIFLVIMSCKLLVYGKQVSSGYFGVLFLLQPIAASLLIIMSFVLLEKHNRVKTLVVVDMIISTMIIADTVYYRYFKDIISFGVIRNGFLLGGVKSSVTSLIKYYDFLYFADILILIPFIKLYRKREIFQPKLAVRIASFAIVLFCGVGIDAKAIYNLSVDQPTLISTMVNRMYITNVLGNINFHALDAYNVITNTISKNKELPKEEQKNIKQVITTNSKISTSNFKDVANGKNLLMIQVEALQQFAIGSKVEGQEITPNLNKWIGKSLYFDNYFYQVAGGNTSDAEFMSNNSLYPAASGAAYYLYAGNEFSSLPKELGDQGYYTAAMHGYTEGFWNRNVMYKAEGFNNFYGEHSYDIKETVGLGLSDKEFFNQSIEKIKKFKEPYYSFMITLSSHFPYDDVKGYGDFNVGSYEGSFLGNYLKGIHYTDAQIGMFLDKLQAEGMLDNTIVVLYGDHYAIPKEHMQELYNFKGIKENDLNWFQLQKVPMFIHFPQDSNKGVNHTYAGQMDLYPTLANMFNLPKKYMLGKDILNSKDGTVTFRNGSFTDGNVFYVSWTNTYYNIKTGEKVEEVGELEDMKQDAMDYLKYSDDILNHNLIKVYEQK